MRILQTCDFEKNRSAGAAGAVLDVEDGLKSCGFQVSTLWKDSRRCDRLGPNLARFSEIPRLQFQQVAEALDAHDYDAVIISQPHAHRVYEILSKQHPNTLFLNFTHGWEARYVKHAVQWQNPVHGARRLTRSVVASQLARQCRKAAAAAHGVITSCSLDRDFILDSCRVSAENLVVVPQGLSDEFLLGGPIDHCGQRLPRLLYVGQYVARKGVEVLRRVLPERYRNSRFELTFVTNPDAHDEIRDAYGVMGEDLKVLGWKDRAELIQVYKNNDILVFPSYFEGFGRVYLEAMALGMCVIAFAEGALPDLAENGVHAHLVNVGDEVAFAKKIQQALDDGEGTLGIREAAMREGMAYTIRRSAEQLTNFIHARRDAIGIPAL